MRARFVTFTLLFATAMGMAATSEQSKTGRKQAVQVVRDSMANHRHDHLEAAFHDTYLQRDEEHDGGATREGMTREGTTKVTISQVSVVNGLPY